jgi:hypothetical protein
MLLYASDATFYAPHYRNCAIKMFFLINLCALMRIGATTVDQSGICKWKWIQKVLVLLKNAKIKLRMLCKMLITVLILFCYERKKNVQKLIIRCQVSLRKFMHSMCIFLPLSLSLLFNLCGAFLMLNLAHWMKIFALRYNEWNLKIKLKPEIRLKKRFNPWIKKPIFGWLNFLK